jgi:hypothetical protein
VKLPSGLASGGSGYGGNLKLSITNLAMPEIRWLVARFKPRSGHVGFVVDEEVLGQVFSEYFCLI